MQNKDYGHPPAGAALSSDDGAASVSTLRASIADAVETLTRILPLLGQITVRQAIEAGDDVIDACGINPWCMKEGLAEGDEPALSWWRIQGIETALRDLETFAQGMAARSGETGTGSTEGNSPVRKDAP